MIKETSELTELRRDDPREVASAGVREVDVDVTKKVDCAVMRGRRRVRVMRRVFVSLILRWWWLLLEVLEFGLTTDEDAMIRRDSDKRIGRSTLLRVSLHSHHYGQERD